MPTRCRLFAGVEFGREAAVRHHHVDRVAGLQLIADPVGEQPAADALDGHHPVGLVGRGAQRVIAAHFLAVDRRAKRQMLTRLERESLAQLGRDFEADRIGFGGLRDDLRDLQRVEMNRPSTRSRRDRCAAGTASPRANGRDVRCDGRAGRRGSDAGPRALQAALQQAPRRWPSDILPRTHAGRARSPHRSPPERLVDLEQLGHEAPAPVEPVGHAPRAFLGAVAEADRPFGRELAVIGDFLHRLVRELAQELVARSASAAGAACAARSCRAGAGRWSARSRRWAARPAGNCESRARRGGRRAGRRRRPRPSSSVACPTRSSARLARLMSTSSTGPWPHHSPSRWPSTSASSPRRSR